MSKKKICEICGKELDRKYWINEEYYNICSSSQCFEEKFWQLIIKEKDEHVIIDGECYSFDKNNPIADGSKTFLGFDGRRFKIKMLHTGEVFETNNLWSNGKVPDKFKEQLPDNAEFVWQEL